MYNLQDIVKRENRGAKDRILKQQKAEMYFNHEYRCLI